MSTVAAMNEEFSQRRHKARSRKDKDGQEKTIELQVLRDRSDELVTLYKSSCGAKESFGSAVKAVAEKSGLMSSTIRKWVQAKYADKFVDKKRDAQQLALVFEECE